MVKRRLVTWRYMLGAVWGGGVMGPPVGKWGGRCTTKAQSSARNRAKLPEQHQPNPTPLLPQHRVAGRQRAAARRATACWRPWEVWVGQGRRDHRGSQVVHYNLSWRESGPKSRFESHHGPGLSDA